MKTYQRIEHCGGYVRITEVKEDGSWHCWSQWPDGMTLNHSYMNILEMGWRSLNEFLACKPHFKAI